MKDGVERHRTLDLGQRYRAITHLGIGTVIGVVELNGTLTGLDVLLDSARRATLWPALVRQAPPPAGKPGLVCLHGGRA